MKSHVAAVAALVLFSSLALAAEPGKEFQLIGIGGGGAIYTPTVYPGDSSVLFVTCDMSGVYRSADAGKTWSFLHFKQLNSALSTRPAFTKDAMYWVSGNELKVSRDKGQTWQGVIAGEQPWKGEPVTHLAALDGGAVVVGTAKGVWASTDHKAWRQVSGGRCSGLLALGETLYLATQTADGKKHQAFQLSTDVGQTWQDLAVDLANGSPITALTGAGPAGGSAELFVTVATVGVLKSADAGKTWQAAMKWDKQADLLMPPGQDQVAYVCQRPGKQLWRTADGGQTWTSIFHMDFFGKGNVELSWLQSYLRWDYVITDYGIGIDPNDPNTVLLTTQGELYISRDGGKSWRPFINQAEKTPADARGWAFKGTGLEVTVSSGYAFDPNDANRQYILYEDIGFARSLNKGQSWIPATIGCPWGNTFYEILFDPFVKGRIYAACSSRHDIPAWLHVSANTSAQKGGICVSDDYAATWRVLSNDLPQLPCTSLVLDPRSTADKLTMYAGFFEGGVYKTNDGGKTWQNKSKGLGNEGNLHVWKLFIHPRTGNLYCVITAFRKDRAFPVPGGLWKSADGGDTWTDLTADLKLAWPSGFAVHPDDESIIYLVAGTAPEQHQGGLYKTANGGKTWKTVLTDVDLAKWCPPGYSNYGCVKLHPDDPSLVYFGTESHGLWLSRDAGQKWEVYQAFPFRGVTDLTFDPQDHHTLYVSTYGVSVLKGPHLPTK